MFSFLYAAKKKFAIDVEEGGMQMDKNGTEVDDNALTTLVEVDPSIESWCGKQVKSRGEYP